MEEQLTIENLMREYTDEQVYKPYFAKKERQYKNVDA